MVGCHRSYTRPLYILLALGVVLFGMQGRQAKAAIIAGTVTTSTSAATITSSTVSVNIASSSSSALFVTVADQFGAVASASYNGVPMVKLWGVLDGAGVTEDAGFILGNPATGTHNLIVQWATNNGGIDAIMAQPYYGVAQGNTTNTTYRAPTFGNDGGNTTTTAKETVSNAQSGDVVIDGIGSYSGPALTPSSSQTVNYEVTNLLSDGFSMGSSYETASGATTMSWTLTPADYWSMGAVPLIPATIPPTISSFSAAPTIVANNGTSTLSWNVSGATSLSINNGIGTVTGTSTTTPALATTTLYTLTAVNSNGTSTATTTVTVDSQAPTVPQNLIATNSTKNSISLSWATSTDNISVAGYNIDRCLGSCTPTSTVATTTQTSYTDSGLAASTTYTYAISAFDEVGNTSALSTSTMASTSAYDVACSGDITTALQNVISAATDGNTIIIGPGTCTISSVVTWTNKNITVMGSGIDVTDINAAQSAFKITITNPAEAAWRLSGFTLQGTNSSNTLINVDGTGAGQWTWGWRIDHVKVNYSGVVSNDPMTIDGVTYGLIDHDDFIVAGGGTFILMAGYMSPEDGSSISKLLGLYDMSLPLDLGTYKALYIENCTFSDNGSGNSYSSFDSSAGGARVVFRYNTLQGVVYSHWTRGGEIGGFKYEVYNNVMTGDSGNQLPLRMEAGTGVIFDNTITGYADQQFWIDERRGQQAQTSSPTLACDGTHAWDGNIEASGWPCLGQIGRSPGSAPGNQTTSPLYAWNNGTSTGCSTGGSCINSVNLTVFDLGTGIDPTLFLKTTGSPHTNGNVDYVNNGSTPMPGYTPFTYPYPLNANGMPSSSTIPTISSFSASPQEVLSGGTSTLSWSVSNASSVLLTGTGLNLSTTTQIGSTNVNPTSTTIFTLSASNSNGTSTATTTVTVTSAGQTISFVQSTSSAPNFLGGAGTTTATFGSNTTAGDFIVVTVGGSGISSFPTGTISDTEGDTFTLATSTNCGCGGFYVDNYLYYAANIRGGADAVSFHWNTTNWNIVGIDEYSGVATSSPLDQINQGSGANLTSISSGNVTTTQANELLFSSFAGTSGGTPSVSAGWTTELSNNANGNIDIDSANEIASTTGNYSNTFSGLASYGTGGVYIVAFKSGAPAPPTISSFTASPTIVALAGTSTLSWSVTNASSVAITPGNLSTSTLVGSTVVNPTSTKVYILAAANSNGTSTATTTVTVDNTPPTTPTSVVASATGISSISVSWANSTDSGGSGLAGYNIFRCTGGSCTPTARLATSSNNSYSDSGLAASTTYTYAISAFDGVGNTSATSSNAGATTQAAGSSTIYAATCAVADVQAAVNSSTNGGTVIIPSCSSGVTWSTGLTITDGITLIGQGAGNTVITDGTSKGDSNCQGTTPLINVSESTNVPVRISGFTINGEPPAYNCGESADHISINGSTHQFRVDDITFNLDVTGVNTGGDVWGLIDHNTFNDAADVFPVAVHHESWQGVGAWGDNSWAQPDTMGTPAAVYIENNSFSFTSGGSFPVGCFDSEEGGRLVFRDNTGCPFVGVHGTDSSGRYRSVREYEIYGNTFVAQPNPNGNMYTGVFLRGGTGMIFNNNFSDNVPSSTPYNTLILPTNYRDTNDAWAPWGSNDGSGGCDGRAPFDTDTGITYATGTYNGAGGTTEILTDTTKNWATNQWVGYSAVDITAGWGSAIDSNTATTVTTEAAAQGTAHAWTTGDSYEILKAYPCIDQIGRGMGLLVRDLVNGDGLPVLNSTGNPGPVDESSDPLYEWGNDHNGIEQAAIVSETPQHVAANRDYYDWTSSFTGTSGVGSGLLSARPSTCTAGVGYWATDTNVLYQCSTTNVWSPYYSPAPYPYPLTTGGFPNDPKLTATSSSSNDGSISQFPAGTNFVAGTNVTLTANASSGYVFAGWTGSVSTTTNPVTVTMNSNMTETADFSSASSSPLISSFSASPQYTEPSVTSTLSWTVSNASSVSITPGGFSTSTLVGSWYVAPTSTTIYTLTAGSPNGTSTAQTTITVQSIPPSIPQNLSANPVSPSEIDLSWTASTSTIPIAGYDLYQNGTKIASTSNTSYANTGLNQATTYTYTVDAFDAAGNVSPQSSSTSATTETEQSGGGGGGGGGGGDGGGYYYEPPATTTASSTPGTASESSLLATLLAELEGLIKQLNTELVASFTRNLTIGSTGADVKNLQVFLNDNGYTIASSGPGSLGKESTYFGVKTQEALAKWQKANGLPATGFFGGLTRGVMKKLY